ncbi:MAG: MarR family transcriptional regulator [Ardenticatenaceae bacterium]|nr:MarR family transcriptional regulator [Anaerolineales bacterium]MCB8920281.1 MarR family transcriptional regulator [Ardenticatenaceae bacterium]
MNEDNLQQSALEIQTYAALLLKYFNQGLEQRLHEYGEKMSSLQYGILRMIQFEPLTVSELGRRLGLNPSTLVRSVDALERKGLAQRGSDPQDRRRNPVALTEKGMALLTAVPTVAPDDIAFQVIQSLGADSAEQLKLLLRELIVRFPEGPVIVAAFM